jgi:hypothetical protein
MNALVDTQALIRSASQSPYPWALRRPSASRLCRRMRQDLRLTRSDPGSSRAACCESLRYGRNLSQVHTQLLRFGHPASRSARCAGRNRNTQVWPRSAPSRRGCAGVLFAHLPASSCLAPHPSCFPAAMPGASPGIAPGIVTTVLPEHYWHAIRRTFSRVLTVSVRTVIPAPVPAVTPDAPPRATRGTETGSAGTVTAQVNG